MLRDFDQHVTVVGLDRICNSVYCLLHRIIWGALVAFATIFLIYHLYNRISYFFEYPVLVSVQVEYMNSQRFPSVTICNVNPIRLNLDNPNFTELDRQLVRRFMGENLTIPGFNSSSYNWDSFVQLTAHHIDDMLVECFFEQLNCSSLNFTAMHTDHALCYTFNYDGSLNTSWTGMDFGLRLLLNSQLDHDSYREREESGFRIVIHDHDEIPIVMSSAMAAGVGLATNVGLRKTVYENLPRPTGKCGTRPLTLFNTYSPSYCETECMINVTIGLCGCRYLYMKHPTTPVCDPMTVMWDQCAELVVPKIGQALQNCDCPVACNDIRYTKSVSNTHLNPLRAHHYALNESEFLSQMVLFSLFLDMTSTVIVQRHAYSWLALLSDCGGACGLMMGCCLFTLAQVIDYLVTFTIRCIHRSSKDFFIGYQPNSSTGGASGGGSGGGGSGGGGNVDLYSSSYGVHVSGRAPLILSEDDLSSCRPQRHFGYSPGHYDSQFTMTEHNTSPDYLLQVYEPRLLSDGVNWNRQDLQPTSNQSPTLWGRKRKRKHLGYSDTLSSSGKAFAIETSGAQHESPAPTLHCWRRSASSTRPNVLAGISSSAGGFSTPCDQLALMPGAQGPPTAYGFSGANLLHRRTCNGVAGSGCIGRSSSQRRRQGRGWLTTQV